MSGPITDVVAAIIERRGAFLMTRRLDGTHLAGLWEFPGGKIHPGETHVAALRREILEELSADVEVGALVFETSHAYPDRTVALHFYRCGLADEPRPALGQQMRWVTRAELATLEVPPADEDLVRWIVSSR